jgi:hypothetical protein
MFVNIRSISAMPESYTDNVFIFKPLDYGNVYHLLVNITTLYISQSGVEKVSLFVRETLFA